MSTSLYQKYRPQQFADLIGQEHIATTLRNELRTGTTAHAYLLSGPRGIGKTSSARLLARAVNCTNLQDGEPDNACTNCQTIIAGKAVDIMEIDAASHTGVDNVRENIIESSRVAPAQLPVKVFIIDEVHMLSGSAFNALLKTLEEPPQKTLFILATTELHKVPETVVSRCERFGFHRVSRSDLVQQLQHIVELEGRAVDQDVLRTIAARSDGAVRDAESLLGQILSITTNQVTLDSAAVVLPRSQVADTVELLSAIIRNNPDAAVKSIQQLVDTGTVLSLFVSESIELLRQVLLAALSGNDEPITALCIDAAVEQKLLAMRPELSTQRVSQIIRSLMQASTEMKTASIEQLPLELALVDLTTQEVLTTPPTSDLIPTPPITEQPPAASFHQRRVPDAQPEPEPVPARSQQVTLEMMQQRWQEVLVAIREKNHALHLTFKVGQLVSVESNTLTMGFQYQFYQDRLNDAKNGAMIVAALEQVFGSKLHLQTVIGNKYAPESFTHNPEANIEEPTTDEIANVWELAATAFPEDGQPA